MTISWYGFNYFKIQNTKKAVVFNPYSLDKTTKFPKTKADVVLFSDPEKIKDAKYHKEAFIIDSPGEYEHSDIFVYGRQINGNIIYLLVFENIKIAFLGEYGHQELTNSDLGLVEGADVLILPVGGNDLTTAKEARKLISQIEPRVVIPSCHAAGSGKLNLDNVSDFIKEFGVKAQEEEKFKLSRKDLPQEDIKLIVLKTQV